MKWQYKCVIEGNNYFLRKAMNKLGARGWEAYSVVRIKYRYGEAYIAYLKRPKP